MPIISYKNTSPQTGTNLFLAPDAWLIGRVTIAEDVSIFFGSVLRGDIEPIEVGAGSNLQEHCVLHTSHGYPCIVRQNVTVGHQVRLHSCTVEAGCIIGMGSTVLDGAVVGESCMIGANSLISRGANIPPRSLAYGSPAKVIRPLTEEELAWLKASALHYQEKGREYREIFAAR